MKLTVIGSGDAFGSGGRLQTCFHVSHTDGNFLIDCGATSVLGLTQQGLDLNKISTIFISHLHGDHFGGLPWVLIHALFMSGRTAPLTIVGPEGTVERFTTLAEAVYPGSTTYSRAFELHFLTYPEHGTLSIGGVTVEAFEVIHPCGARPYALRISANDRVIGFSGDTRWTDQLIKVADRADLFICECTNFEAENPVHLNWRTLATHLDALHARTIMLTHFGPEMIARCHEIAHPKVAVSRDGKVLEL